jgi:hypothetical protein
VWPAHQGGGGSSRGFFPSWEIMMISSPLGSLYIVGRGVIRLKRIYNF